MELKRPLDYLKVCVNVNWKLRFSKQFTFLWNTFIAHSQTHCVNVQGSIKITKLD